MIERELRSLAAFVETSAERDLAPAVRARLTPRPHRRRALVLVLAALVLAVAVAFAVPPARSAILRLLHLRGVRIEHVDRLPEVRTTAPLDLGVPVPPGEAVRIAGFAPLTSALLGEPDRITWDGAMLWFRYGRARLLVSQFRGSTRPELVKKFAGPQTTITPVTVRGEPGFFFSGATHFMYVAPTGLYRQERIRLARDVLLWQHGPLTLRLEGELSLRRALEIADSLR